VQVVHDVNSARIANLSILTTIPASGSDFTMGYVVGGASASAPKPLVIRAAGPSLVPLNVPGTLDDPKLELFTGPTKTGENDNWGGTTALRDAMAAVGAFAYVNPSSRDAAVLTTISNSGTNSVLVSAAGTGTGAVIAEIYDSTPATPFSITSPRLVNVSVLKPLGTGLTVGFVVDGFGTKNVLVRAIGPTLATAFNLNGAAADPQLTLFQGTTPIGSNDNWGSTNAAALTAAFDQVAAFALPAGSRDAALVATLGPGNYSVQVGGVGGTTGTALVEVYELP
jgi:hypothetical protein